MLHLLDCPNKFRDLYQLTDYILLDSILEKLNSGSTSLDEMVSLYEQGIELVNHCTELLNSYRSRIDKVMVQNND